MAKKQKRQVSRSAAPAAREYTPAAQPGEVVTPLSGGSGAPRAAGYTRSAPTPTDFNPDYSYVISDLKRIGILAGTFITILVVLSFFLR